MTSPKGQTESVLRRLFPPEPLRFYQGRFSFAKEKHLGLNICFNEHKRMKRNNFSSKILLTPFDEEVKRDKAKSVFEWKLFIMKKKLFEEILPKNFKF